MSDLFVWIYSGEGGREVHETFWGGGGAMEVCNVCFIFIFYLSFLALPIIVVEMLAVLIIEIQGSFLRLDARYPNSVSDPIVEIL
jgi:hypothetical protein